MAVNIPNTNAQPKENYAPQQQPSSSAGVFNLMSGMPLGASLPINMGAEFTNKLNEAIKEIFKKSTGNAELDTVVIDNTVEKRLAFSVIIITQKNKGDSRVAYHTLVLEATGEKLIPQTENIEGVMTEILRLPSDAIDGAMRTIVNDVLTAKYPGDTLISVDGCVVPMNFDVTNPQRMIGLCTNATLATGTELLRLTPNFPDLTIADIKAIDQLQINLDFARNSIRFTDAVGEPVRGDIQIRFEKIPKSQQNRFAINAKDPSILISEINSFIDFMWAPVAINPMMVYNMPQQMPKFMAQQVITNINSTLAFTPSAMMLYIASAMTLAENNNWMFLFRPSIDQDPMTDISALNCEGNIGGKPNEMGQKLDLLNDPAGAEAYYRFMQSLVRPGLALAIDIPDLGPQTWYTSMIMAACVKNNQQAKRMIYDAVSRLTGGAITRYLNPDDHFFAGGGERIHLGYYTDKKGQRRDIRDIDYLVVANHFGETNPQAVRDWSDTYTLVGHNQYKRLAARKRFISSLTGDEAKFTGMATRITFSVKFIEAVSNAIKESGLPVSINNPLANTGVVARGSVSWADQALGMSNGMFTSPVVGGSSFSGPGINTGRW